jgi:hypothetical protein
VKNGVRTHPVKLGLIALAALFMLAIPSPATGQGGGSVTSILLEFPAGAKVLSDTTIPIQVTGELTVSFHGSVAGGCVATGLCPYSGTIVVSPRSGQLEIEKYRNRGRTGELAFLSLNPGVGGYTTVADVERSVPGQTSGLCADAQSPSLGSISPLLRRGSTLRITLLQAGGTVLSTRCAGPLDGDLASVSPQATIPLAALRRGEESINLAASSPFASHGFAGTLDSTLRLKLGRPQSNSVKPTFPPGIKTQPVRTVIEHLALVRVGGGLSASVQGTDDPIVCGLLDSCGLTGTLTLGVPSHGSAGTLSATGPASRPYVDFLAALGLSRTGNRRGIAVGGGIDVGSAGTVAGEETQSGAACADSASTAPLAVTLVGRGGALTGGANSLGTWRTRCPGPMIGPETQLLSAAPVPRAAIGRRTFTIRLSAGGPLVDDGYSISPQGQLSVTVRRVGLTQVVSTRPTG